MTTSSSRNRGSTRQVLLVHRQRDHSEIQRVGQHALHQLAGEVTVNPQAHFRIAGAKGGKHRRQHVERGGFVGTHRQSPARHVTHPFQSFLGLAPQLGQLLAVLQQDAPRRCQLHLLASPVEQLLSQLLLERAHLLGDRWLSPVEMLGGPREAVVLGNLDNCVYLVKIHRWRQVVRSCLFRNMSIPDTGCTRNPFSALPLCSFENPHSKPRPSLPSISPGRLCCAA